MTDREAPITPEAMLRGEVQEFFDANIYPGFGNPFVLEDIKRVIVETRPEVDVRVVIIKGMQEEDIGERDSQWMRGLREVGMRWETELRLPSHYFER